MLFKTFSYLNCTLQNEKLNRVHWRLLEDYERLLAFVEGPVNVEIKIVFDKSVFVKVEPVKITLLKLAPVKLAPDKILFDKSVFVKLLFVP